MKLSKTKKKECQSKIWLISKNTELDDIYNADETGLLFKAQATKTMQYKNMPANSVKINKERLSILLACNWSGKHKLKPVVTGKYASSTLTI